MRSHASAPAIDTLLSVRLPPETRARIRALAALRSCSASEVVIVACEHYGARLSRQMQRLVAAIMEARQRQAR